jgi:hypothetical protein
MGFNTICLMATIVSSSDSTDGRNFLRPPSLYSLGSGPQRKHRFHGFFIVAGRCLAMARLFIEPFPRNGQCLSSHVTVILNFNLMLVEQLKQKG